MIPSIALITTTHPNLTRVNNVAATNNVSLYPNPASDFLNVSLTLDQMANSVTYKVIDGLGRAVGKQTHTNVQSEVYSINTAEMHAGTYFLLITADDKHVTAKKFAVIH